MRRIIPYILLFFCCAGFSLQGFSQLKADFFADTLSGCAPLIVKFTDASTGNPTQWRWDLGDGKTVFIKDPATTYFNPGIYTVKLVIQNSSGIDSIEKIQYIRIYERPAVNFGASTTRGCFPLNVQFTDFSSSLSGNIISWQWDFGDGQSSTDKNPVHVYSSAGNFNISLRVINSNGCEQTITKPNLIRIDAGANASFNFEAPENCLPPISIQFNNTSTGTGTLRYQWNFGDGNESILKDPQHSYTGAGVFTVLLTVTNNAGCTDTFSSPPLSIGQVRADFLIPDTICSGSTINLTNTSTPSPTGAFWNFGDGNTSSSIDVQHLFQNPGTYPVTLRSDFGACQVEVTKIIEVLAAPVIDFTADKTTSCLIPATISFNSMGNAAFYQWDFGDGIRSIEKDPLHNYAGMGEYTITLSASNALGCTTSITREKYIKVGQPVAELRALPLEACAPFSYSPQLNMLSSDTISSFEWDFGDGTISIEENPSHLYTRSGTYTITLKYTTNSGCRDSLIYKDGIRIGEKPEINFSAMPRIGCAFQPVNFTDNSTGAQADQWLWYFGDGGTSTDQNPAHIYQDTGYFSVKLIIWNNGCSDSLTLSDYIYIRPPIAKFYDSIGSCDDKFTRHFKDLSIGASSWSWDFGDGKSSTEPEPVHTYASPGEYIVVLTVSNDTCEHTTSLQIIIAGETAQFDVPDTDPCRNASLEFMAAVSNLLHVQSFAWDFGDGNSALGQIVTHKYSDTGTYSVGLIISDIHGCKDTLIRSNSIHVKGPDARFTVTPDNYCNDEPIIFIDSSSGDGRSPIVQWTWDYGDGVSETLTGGPFSHAYSQRGNYRVRLTVIDSAGCVHESIQPGAARVFQPQVNFSSQDTISCSGTAILFSNLSQGNSLQFDWSFGDDNNSNEPSPIHEFIHEGEYTIKLIATDQYGCIDSLSKPEYISIRNPVAVLNVSDSVATCPPLVVDFSHQSQNYNSLSWDFGDGTTSLVEAPGHFYSFAGTYPANLIVTSPGGCRDTASINIVVRGPEGSFTYDSISGCSPTIVNFIGTTGDDASFVWDFNDGTVLDADSLVSHTYSLPGLYVPKMILVDPDGCRVPIPGQDTIRIFGAVANFSSSGKVFCDSAVVDFRDSSISNEAITRYQWDFGDGSTSSSPNPGHIYKNPGEYSVQLQVTTASGCLDTTLLEHRILIARSPEIEILGDSSGCVPVFNKFQAKTSQAELNWNWNFGNGSSSSLFEPDAIRYETAGNYRVNLVGTNSYGCADTTSVEFIAHPLPTTDAGPPKTICLGEPITLQASGADSFTWRGPAIDCRNCSSPVVKPVNDSWYITEGKNIFGCTTEDSVIITVKKPFKIEVNTGDTICIGESVTLNASGAEKYQWLPTIGLNNASTGNPVARPDNSVTYMVTGSDEAGCFTDTASVHLTVYPIPQVNAGEDQVIGSGSSTLLRAEVSSDVSRIRWFPPIGLECAECAETVARPKVQTTYRIEVENEGRCKSSDEINVHVFCNNTNLFVPNTFTPNGDGRNDHFFPRGSGIFTIRMLRVFNRWGEIVFEKSNFQANDERYGWDGTYKNSKASQDVYVYSLELICENQEILRFKGNVALIR